MKKLISLIVLLLPLTAAAYDLDLDKNRVEVEDASGRWKLARVADRIQVDATEAEVWQALAMYGDVHKIHASITESYSINDPVLKEGSERFCRIEFKGRVVEIEERVEEIEAGAWYQYGVYTWKNFPLKKMNSVFGVTTDSDGTTWIYNIVDFRLNPGMMTGLMRGSMRKNVRGSLLVYKHYIETGETNGDPALL